MGFLNLFQSYSDAPTIQDYLSKDALIIDVRTSEEFTQGHAKHAINIPLDQIQNRLQELTLKSRAIILCCRSGNRSGKAHAFLSSQNIDCINGGSWQNVQKNLDQYKKIAKP